MSYLGLLPPFLSAVLLFLFVTRLYSRKPLIQGRFLPFFISAISFASLVVILTETLSAFSALSSKGLTNAWRLSAAILALLNLSLSRKFPSRSATSMVGGAPSRSYSLSSLNLRMRARIGSLWRSAIRSDRLSSLLIVALLGLFLLTLMVAIVYPPNNVDSINYHVARVMHWGQQGSVAYYPTAILMQLQGAPLAEYFLLHLYLLTGSDALMNTAQWLSLLLAVFAVYSAAELLFHRSGLAAGILAACIPMGVLQATSTQNDLVAASWLAVSVYLGLCVLRSPSINFVLFFTTLALGLAVLTKPTIFPIGAPFAVAFFGYLLIRRRRRFAVLLAAALIVLPSMPFYLRNLVFFGLGSPYGPTWGISNATVSVEGVASNVIRNAALHGQTPLSGGLFEAFNSAALGMLRRFHEGLRIPADDLRFSLLKADAFQPNACGLRVRGDAHVFHEDCSGNPLHLLLFVAFLPVVLARVIRPSAGFGAARRCVVARRAGLLMGLVVVGFVALSGYLKWQPFGSRLDLPLFVVACIPLGGLVGSLRRTVRSILLAGILGYALLAACLNATRPILPLLVTTHFDRQAAYFANHPDLLIPYVGMVRAIKTVGCRDVGYRIGSDPFEYPFWVLLAQGGYRFRFEHVDIQHPSARLRDMSFKPCVIISPDAVPGYEGRFDDVGFGSYHLYTVRRVSSL